MKKDFKFFLIGSVFGIFEVMVLFNSDQSTKTLLQKFLAIISFPFSVFDPIDKATDFTCSIFNLSFCRRLGFDGGPDDWVQFLILTFLVIILIIFFYGLVFFFGAKIVRWYKEKKNSDENK